MGEGAVVTRHVWRPQPEPTDGFPCWPMAAALLALVGLLAWHLYRLPPCPCACPPPPSEATP